MPSARAAAPWAPASSPASSSRRCEVESASRDWPRSCHPLEIPAKRAGLGCSRPPNPNPRPLSRKKCDKLVELRYVSPPARVGLGSRGVAQLVERRSPKPKAGGSRPSAPANHCYASHAAPARRVEAAQRSRTIRSGRPRVFAAGGAWADEKSPDVHPRGTSGSIESDVADLERGLDHDGHGARSWSPSHRSSS